jgi:hypothetical protein
MAEPIEPTIKRKEAFTGWPIVIGLIAMLIFAIHASTHMVAAGDTWVAMACGRHFINHGVNTVEPFSANSHHAGPTEEDIKNWPDWAQSITAKVGLKTVQYWHPTGWINQNWLTHVIFYWLTTLSPFADADSLKFNTLVYWKYAIYILAILSVYGIGRLLKANPVLCAVFACFALFVGRSFFDIRPAGFSNLLVPVFILILILATYKNIWYLWLTVPLTVFWCNLHGGYLYVFIMLVAFMIMHLLTCLSKKIFVTVGLKGVYHIMAVGIVSFVAMIVFNPFHLTNLTHTFDISISQHAEMWRSVNEWHPAFEWDNPVGTGVPFLIMFIIAWVVLIAWVVSLVVTSKAVNSYIAKIKQNAIEQYELPKIDLALILIAALTIYMAIRSRRFIPIAAMVACPIIAMMIDQIIKGIAAASNFRKNNKLQVPEIDGRLKSFIICAGAAATLFFGIWWGLEFKKVYLDPWPTEKKLNSVFMRMSASDVKPFYACQFIRDNKLKGNMFNYWTEGGFIAYGQEPDPNTGKTPLQLFMDGRAQAAYETNAYMEWSNIMVGGPLAAQLTEGAQARGRELTDRDYLKIGKWLDGEFKKHKVWVFMMPYAECDKASTLGIEQHPDWRLIYLDTKQKIFVNITTEDGKRLFDGIDTDETKYPNDFTKYLMKSYKLMFYSDNIEGQKQGLEYAIKALEDSPSETAMRQIMYMGNAAPFRSRIYDVSKNYFDDFEKNKSIYAKEDGMFDRMTAALLAINFLEQYSNGIKDYDSAKLYSSKKMEYLRKELPDMLKSKRW